MEEAEVIKKALQTLVENQNVMTSSSELLNLSNTTAFEHYLINSGLFAFEKGNGQYYNSFQVLENFYNGNANGMFIKWEQNKIIDYKSQVLNLMYDQLKSTFQWEVITNQLNIDKYFSRRLKDLLIYEGFINERATNAGTFIFPTTKLSVHRFADDKAVGLGITLNTGDTVHNHGGIIINKSNLEKPFISNNLPEKKNYKMEIIIGVIIAVVAAGAVKLLGWV